MGQWNGQWKVLVGGQEVYRFGGVGNSQADANRIAAAWLRQNGQGVSGEGFEVYPVMDESLREYKMPQPSQGPGRYRDLNEPLGPESPPKMPSGTVKVDVSDTQDWYQLGQDISNLAIANKAHYNQGPPHTVLAFGSEDLEHMYIRQLKRLGLNTHDLDEPGEDDLDEGVKSALATAALAGTMAMGAQAKAPDMVQQIVEPGDTVYSIARQTGADPKEIYRLNKMDRNTKLEVGQRVIVPDYSKPVSKMPATATPTVKPPVVQAAPPTPSLKDKISSIIPKFSSDNKEEQGVTLLSDNTDAEAALQTAAKAAGLTGVELAQFMAQTRHESWDFGKMKEVGNKKQFAKYDAPRKAKQLGNKVRGDGERFKGRGFIQLTGRDNYTRASQQIFGDDRLVKNPDLASRLDVGAQIALWFWKNQVRPNVSNFNNTKEVTNAINPGLSGLQDRHTKFKEYLAVL
jgi:putative chitinase